MSETNIAEFADELLQYSRKQYLQRIIKKIKKESIIKILYENNIPIGYETGIQN